MARNFSELRRKLEARPDHEAKTAAADRRLRERTDMRIGSALRLVRIDRGATQVDLAAAMGITQPQVSRIENNDRDLLVSTLQRYVEGLGGDLSIFIDFPGADPVRLHITTEETTP